MVARKFVCLLSIYTDIYRKRMALLEWLEQNLHSHCIQIYACSLAIISIQNFITLFTDDHRAVSPTQLVFKPRDSLLDWIVSLPNSTSYEFKGIGFVTYLLLFAVKMSRIILLTYETNDERPTKGLSSGDVTWSRLKVNPVSWPRPH